MRLCVISVKPGAEKNSSFESSLRKDEKMMGVQKFIEFEKSLINNKNSPVIYKKDDPGNPNKQQVLSNIKSRYDKKYPNVRLDKFIYESNRTNEKVIDLPSADPNNPKEFRMHCVEVAKKLGMPTWMSPKKNKYDETKPRVYTEKRSMSVQQSPNQRNSHTPVKFTSFRPSPLPSRINSRKNSENVNTKLFAKEIDEYSPKYKKSFDKKATISSDFEKNIMMESGANAKIALPRDIANDEKLKFQHLYQHFKQPSNGNIKADFDNDPNRSLPAIRETKESPRSSAFISIEKRMTERKNNTMQTEGNISFTEKSPEKNTEAQLNKIYGKANKIQKQKERDEKEVENLFGKIFKNYDKLEKKIYKNGKIAYDFESFVHKSFSKNHDDEHLELRDLSPFKLELEQLISRENEISNANIRSIK